MTVKRRPSGRHHGNLREALEEAALTLVAERGPHGFTLAEACRRAGVSVSAPYKHFADRDALLASLALRGYEEQRRRYRAALDGADDPAEQLAAFATAYVRFAAQERALFDITFLAGLDTAHHPGLAAAGSALHDDLLPVVSRLAPDPEAAFGLLLRVAAAAHGLALFLQQGMLPGHWNTPAAVEAQAADAARSLARTPGDPHACPDR
ncbi:TetR/AcrR family transcriptional regulator [Streptomyces sp. NBC_00198]|uniref:TetR/AcrR family transcriptional regulator n=1 Tax=Streptomyces sp. NBC_00198 TaxID=2975677 RepID=UPI00225193E6|nr:TetR/AcrR family transcriptional regulator [Streptomyces sp. NBC_00198]MCX5281043.1 TetR/AcrR family transcriptional regulator [Streptomyces sp. NBC_00198]